MRLISSGIVRIAAAKPRFDVRDPDAELRGDERGGHRGVDVAVDDEPIGSAAREHRLEPLEDARRLDRVRGGAHLEVEVGRRDLEVVEEPGREERVVMLPGVHDHLLDPDGAAGVIDGSELREIRSGADDVEELHGVPWDGESTLASVTRDAARGAAGRAWRAP
jgi:hypothetical protein